MKNHIITLIVLIITTALLSVVITLKTIKKANKEPVVYVEQNTDSILIANSILELNNKFLNIELDSLKLLIKSQKNHITNINTKKNEKINLITYYNTDSLYHFFATTKLRYNFNSDSSKSRR